MSGVCGGSFNATWFDEKREANREFVVQYFLPESAVRDSEVSINDCDTGKMVRVCSRRSLPLAFRPMGGQDSCASLWRTAAHVAHHTTLLIARALASARAVPEKVPSSGSHAL